MYICIRVYMHTHMCIYMHIYIYIYIHTYVHTHTYSPARKRGTAKGQRTFKSSIGHLLCNHLFQTSKRVIAQNGYGKVTDK